MIGIFLSWVIISLKEFRRTVIRLLPEHVPLTWLIYFHFCWIVLRSENNFLNDRVVYF